MRISVTTDRIAELLRPFLEHSPLSTEQLRAIELYLDLLIKWNSKVNLTAVRDPEEIVTRHFGESIFAARRLFRFGTGSGTLADVGSGAGFPGLVIKLSRPSLEVVLLESNNRKATFLREVIRLLKLESISVLTTRAESVSLKADVVTFRAVEHFDRILSVAHSLVRPEGRLAMLIGLPQVEVAKAVLPAMHWEEPVLIPNSKTRVLLVGKT